MMYLPDYENAIADYLTNSGQNPKDWDIAGAAWEMREKFPDIDSIDQVDPDEFTEILMKYEA
nr:MAG TPA: hypothetical protein [Caudoviricetes sp.]